MVNAMIGGYRCITPMRTAGSGSARWCIAVRGFERVFLKEFLSPVYPVNTDTSLGRLQLVRCRQFEIKKQKLYQAASCVIGDTLVPVIDFFRAEGHYYAVSEAVQEGFITAEKADRLSKQEKEKLLFDLATCLQRLHSQGIVHADLKQEHVLLIRQPDGYLTKLIDLDSGFLVNDPPSAEKEMEGDPAYLAPEAFLRMMGAPAALTPALDVFAFGALIHTIWCGKLPDFDRQKYHYLYEAVLDGGEIELNLPAKWKRVVRRMLCADPAERPTDAAVTAMFAPEMTPPEKSRSRNGLRQLMKETR